MNTVCISRKKRLPQEK